MKELDTNMALLVIDVQRWLFQHPNPVYEERRLLANINTLVARAHVAHVPVVYIQHASERMIEGTDEWKLHPDLQPAPMDLLVHKRHGNAFTDTPLKERLDALHVGHLVVTGLVTQGCVQATCRGAHELGYDAILVSDAHSTFHENAKEVVDACNAQLSAEGVVRLQSTAEVDFGLSSKCNGRPSPDDRSSTRIMTSLIAPCGMNCGICAAHLRVWDRCMGCMSISGPRQHHCDVCTIKACTKRVGGSIFCFDCVSYPCRRLKQLDLRYRTRYGMSMIANLDRIRVDGLDAFVDLENRRWACPICGAPICVHDRKCYACGARWNAGDNPPSRD